MQLEPLVLGISAVEAKRLLAPVGGNSDGDDFQMQMGRTTANINTLHVNWPASPASVMRDSDERGPKSGPEPSTDQR